MMNGKFSALIDSFPNQLTIASRKSSLALCQSEYVRASLLSVFPACKIDILGITTYGDRILDRALSKVGGKGLFVKELENSLMDGYADLAVHSLKDVPMDLPEGLSLAAILSREDPRDVVVLPASQSLNLDRSHQANDKVSFALSNLPDGSTVGTASLRRAAFIARYFPNLRTITLRGNLHTRLERLDNGEYDAIILAAAGLKRLGMDHRINEVLSTDYCVPAAGQGAIGIEVLSARKDLLSKISILNDLSTSLAICVEREASRYLGGSCEVPLSSYAEWLSLDKNTTYPKKDANGQLKLHLSVSMPDASDIIEVSDIERITNFSEAVDFGRHLADVMCARGALSVIERARSFLSKSQ